MFIVSPSPHIHCGDSIRKVMWSVVIALIPAGVAGVIFFGIHALEIILISVITALVSEFLIQEIRRKRISVLDGSAVITGILLAYNLPPTVPLWLPAVGTFVAIVLGKQIFGGLGNNIFNPALVGRAFLMASWPKLMTSFSSPFHPVDALSSATPLAVIKGIEGTGNVHFSYRELFLGNCSGCLGETSALALLIGVSLLFFRKYISWHIPFTYILTVGLLTWIFGRNGLFSGDFLYNILAGGLMLGALFMATDPVTSPLSNKGKIIFGLGCGCITALIRLKGGYPEGVSYSILLMNAFTPLIDKFTLKKKRK
ncbi:MAG: Na+-transporting NADH:ubiquinone oxidoreductase subunit D [Candidatus Omnitrophota bacterium]|nr:MAG: Na+-transporting NADH:ubiquinone oxidoreductase subunit D [Candidatus Omnitrophota bacterium]